MDAEYFTVKELAARWKVNPETVRRLIRRGQLRAVRIGGTKAGHRIERSDVERYERERRGDHGNL